MWKDNEIYKKDLEDITGDSNIDWAKFKETAILVTGATGLIGNLIVNTLLYLNKVKKYNIRVLALVRNIEKAHKIYEKQIQEGLEIKFIIGDVCERIETSEEIDYIIHGASQTSSKMFVEQPVEVSNIILQGTKNVLELAKEKKVKDFVFLSTMEVYGRPTSEDKIDENHGTNLNPKNVRDCYPIAKFNAENLCVCYGQEYGFSTKILRLTQTFGPGVNYNDGRVFAEFARCAIEGKNIVLHTKGDTKRNYLYTADAARAIFTIILKGEEGNIYNVANEDTYCSILEMANMVKSISEKNIDVVIEIEDVSKFGYAPTLLMNLDTSRARQLGWIPKHNLEDMYRNLIDVMRRGEKE